MGRLYLEPIDHYEPDSVHVFIGKGKDAISSAARETYKTSKDGIACRNVVEHTLNTSDYNEVLGEIIEIMNGLHAEYGRDLDIFINITSGTPEFSAAGMFASMLPQSAVAFKVDTDYSMSAKEFSKTIEHLNGSLKISEPERVTGLKNDKPDDEMVVFLRIVNDILKSTKYPKFRTIIDRLKKEDAWSYDPEKKSSYGRTSLQEKEERYLKRHYIAIALENGWLERPSPNTMRLTDSGRAYISVYGTDSDRRIISEHAMCKSEPREKLCFNSCLSDCRSDFDYDSYESNTVTFCGKKKKYTFTIGMDRHR